MGEVWRATDTHLGRQAAIKVLPDAFANDPERLARFEREARMLAALNHPNIAAIYGLERADGTRAIAMELVDGPTLADRIARGPLALDEALAISRQIADALAAAHDQGVVHRDLKPANIKIRGDGTVKVLDFGLAKALDPAGGAPADVTNSPTITSPAMTQHGVILGTAAYMSPEQAKGLAVDRRADVWAFGAVLFEMLTGRRAFDGDDAAEVLAAVIRGEPAWDAIPDRVPRAVHRLLRRCLEKDPRRRLRDVAEGIVQLDDGLTAPAASPVRRSTTLWRTSLAAIAAVALVALAASAYLRLAEDPPRPGVLRVSMTPAEFVVSVNPRPHIGIAPDGRLIYTTDAGLFIKRPDEFNGVPIEGAGRATTPFVSPDGEWLGFVQSNPPDNLLFKVPLGGGPRTPVAVSPGRIYGADWASDDTIVFGTALGLFKVVSGSETPVKVTTASGTPAGAHSWPTFAGSPDLVLFTIGHESSKLAAVTMPTGAVTDLGISGTFPRYLPTGHIAYLTSDGVLRVVAFDRQRIAVRGTPVPFESGVRVRAVDGSVDLDVSDAGTLVYVAAEDDVRLPVWVDRNGVESPISPEARAYTYPRLSFKGDRLVLATREREQDLWLWDFAKPGLRPFVRGTGTGAVWTPDDTAILFSFPRDDQWTIRRLNADGSGRPVEIATSSRPLWPHAIVPDGSAVIVRHGDDIALQRLAEGAPLVTLVANAMNPALSPNGRWLAYDSTKSGTLEVYVKPFPDVQAGEWQISMGFASAPVWSRDGREIFFLSQRKIVSVAVDDRKSFSYGTPRELFDIAAYPAFGLGRHFDVTADGRFVMLKRIERNQPVVRLVMNWFDEVNARVKPR
jgi:serine/threonine-protein kinase